ncbi:hypothetical protein [Maribacter ulvicola]|uniref:Uncharacterized protein n=1 Tax=Maribacter ulvicola TaxID=228959 RepID=A0A1N6YKD5_9FLAO|nr:hypothetical protein [Maribacter ulvicola]SIR14939.1 hypothetical protein SAMN05421797_10726 [Maribacter ulvicola]
MNEENINEIVEKVFQKAKSICSKKSKHALSKHIAESTFVSSRTIERLYDKYLDKKEGVGEQNEHTINVLCQYLGYDSYADYVKQNGLYTTISNVEAQKNDKSKVGKDDYRIWKVLAVVSLIVVVGLILGLSEKHKETLCMTWKTDHFEKVACVAGTNESIIPLDEVRLRNFRKVEVDLITDFFDETTQMPLIWYYKSGGKMEYYTAPGKHPINGKTLKEITEHMVDTYVPLHTYKKNSFVE